MTTREVEEVIDGLWAQMRITQRFPYDLMDVVVVLDAEFFAEAPLEDDDDV